MGVSLKLYEQLTEAGEDKVRARLLAEAFEALEERYPLPEEVATRTHLSETELRLLKEIETVRKEIKELEGRLATEIETVRKEIKELEGRLATEIEIVRKETKELEGRLATEIEAVRKEIKEVELRLVTKMGEFKLDTIKWVAGLLLVQTGVIVGVMMGGLRLLLPAAP